MKPLLIVVGFIALISLAGVLFLPTNPTPVQPNPTCLIGEVLGVSPIWTSNGDGGITVFAEFDYHKARFAVTIVGVCNKEPETIVKLKTCRFIQDLIGKRVIIVGRMVRDSDGHYFVAKLLREL